MLRRGRESLEIGGARVNPALADLQAGVGWRRLAQTQELHDEASVGHSRHSWHSWHSNEVMLKGYFNFNFFRRCKDE